MNWIFQLVDFILHLDKHLIWLFQQYGLWVYGIVFLIIFGETGLVIAPLLPGDSLLFALGAFTATGALNIGWLILLLSIAAILGDSTNYWVGHHWGRRVLKRKVWFINQNYLHKTEEFYKRHGGRTIIIARFLPIIRTFAPFVAGIGKMEYARFFMYNVVGGVLWVLVLLCGGYFFGSIPIVKENFSIAILLIILASSTPVVIELVRQRFLHKGRLGRKGKGGSS